MEGDVFEVLVAEVEGHQADVVIVQVNRLEIALPDVAGHRLAEDGVHLGADPRVVRIDDARIRPRKLPFVPEVDGAEGNVAFGAVGEGKAFGKDVLVSVNVKGVAFQRDGQLEVQFLQASLVVVCEAGREDFDFEVDLLARGGFDEFRRELFDDGAESPDLGAQARVHASDLPGAERDAELFHGKRIRWQRHAILQECSSLTGGGIRRRAVRCAKWFSAGKGEESRTV